MMAGITVNGETRPEAPATVAALLQAEAIAMDARGVAVALNGRVVPRRDWSATVLQPGDQVEIVRPLPGG